jgi:hypothetical protein
MNRNKNLIMCVDLDMDHEHLISFNASYSILLSSGLESLAPGKLGQDTRDRAVGTGQPRQEIASSGQMHSIAVVGQPRQDKEDRTDHDSKKAKLKTVQLGQDSCDRTAGTDQPGQNSRD